ncbi:unnamed protein product [Clavelina lepadiformis]|uniref:Uncharacterized protein n=1 Tax=Clavelina lepadiformis TaxID=159417 RepID=A0ABP0GWM6_CLALP
MIELLDNVRSPSDGFIGPFTEHKDGEIATKCVGRANELRLRLRNDTGVSLQRSEESRVFETNLQSNGTPGKTCAGFAWTQG